MRRRGGVADLKKVSRILLDLKVTGNYLRQYPQLAEKVESALRKGRGQKG
jgi:3-deoxy-D-arabino-heptulosonate 7-phosphate (DAHP) synthase class II